VIAAHRVRYESGKLDFTVLWMWEEGQGDVLVVDHI